jgi:hypothetical protein
VLVFGLVQFRKKKALPKHRRQEEIFREFQLDFLIGSPFFGASYQKIILKFMKISEGKSKVK